MSVGNSTSSIVQGWINSSGKADTPEKALTAAESGPQEEMSQAEEGYDTEVMSENSTLEDLLPGGEDTPPDSSTNSEKKASSESKPTKTSETKEVITITDETGRRKKVEIDYSDRAAIKKAHEMMHGARKWQAERDQALQSRKTVESELSKAQSQWQMLEKAWSNGGIEGLVDLLEGQGAYNKRVQQAVQKAEFLKNASPEEIRELQAREETQKQSRELAKIRKENEDFKKQVQQERETAELRSVESQVNPVFDKYRFADKLGNPDDEHMFDEMLWNTALKRLEPYETQGVLTPEVIEREFYNVSRTLRSRIGQQAEKKAARTIEQKKKEATENVQAKVMSGYKSDGVASEARNLINSGNITGLLKGWGKYGSLFNNKK